jgi:hypothetical protein
VRIIYFNSTPACNIYADAAAVAHVTVRPRDDRPSAESAVRSARRWPRRRSGRWPMPTVTREMPGRSVRARARVSPRIEQCASSAGRVCPPECSVRAVRWAARVENCAGGQAATAVTRARGAVIVYYDASAINVIFGLV